MLMFQQVYLVVMRVRESEKNLDSKADVCYVYATPLSCRIRPDSDRIETWRMLRFLWSYGT